ncbi:MAG: hypothetical protein VB084_04485 [Syntrophomonadaceae bacterium]|nr:hypothetical protein [Syntrophomonadaceae bacterium]
MTALAFIFIAALVLLLLVYWILNTGQKYDHIITNPADFNFELASELALDGRDEFYLAQNTIKIQLSGNEYGQVFWNLGRAQWEKVCAENGLKPDIRQIVLRLAEIGDRVDYSDMWVMTTAGQYRFRLKPGNCYYMTLGIKHGQLFIPILTSNTIMLHG